MRQVAVRQLHTPSMTGAGEGRAGERQLSKARAACWEAGADGRAAVVKLL